MSIHDGHRERLKNRFLEQGLERVSVRADERQAWFLEALEKMGFVRRAEGDGLIALTVEKAAFLDRKYLF